MLRLPFNNKSSDLGNSYEAARSMLLNMERRFKGNKELQDLYRDFMNEYIELGHMRLVDNENLIDKNEVAFYLPHHGVFKTVGDKSKLRVVFNGSVRLTNGYNLNECLLPGQKLLADLVDVLLKWLLYQYLSSQQISLRCLGNSSLPQQI